MTSEWSGNPLLSVTSALAPRMTAPNQTLTSVARSTLPTTCAFGAIHRGSGPTTVEPDKIPHSKLAGAVEVDDMAMMRLLAREGVGLAVLPPIVVRDELASGEL